MINPAAPETKLPRRISVLGATGSIGVSTLDVLNQAGGREQFEIIALTGMGNVELLAAQAKAVGARIAVTADVAKYADLKAALAGSGIEAAAGGDALCAAAAESADWVMAGIVGIAGLAPTMAAARAGATIALANNSASFQPVIYFWPKPAKPVLPFCRSIASIQPSTSALRASRNIRLSKLY